MQRPEGPTITLSPSSISGFTSTAGTQGVPQTYILGWNFWAGANITVTAPSNYVISKDNSTYSTSATVSTSGSTGSTAIYIALASSNTAGSYSGNVANSATGGVTTQNVAVSGTTSAGTPTLSLSPTSLTGFTSTAGSLGGSQSYVLTGSSLTGNVTITAPSGFSVSLNNSSFASSQTVTPSGGAVSQTVYAALAAANTTGSYSGNITHASTGATTQNEAVSGVTSGSSIIPDSMMFIFDSANIITATNKQNVTGDPHSRVLSGTHTGTAITYSTVSTSTNNWSPTGSPLTCMFPNDGMSTATIPAGFSGSGGAMSEAAFTGNVYNTTYPQFITGGWKTDGTTYDIEVSGCTNFSVSANTTFNVQGASLQTSQTFLAQSNTSNKATWTNIAPDASGNFTFYMGKAASGELFGFISYIKITKH